MSGSEWKRRTNELFLLTVVPVVSEEDIITLVVEGHCPSTLEFWLVMEKSTKHSAYGVTQTSCKVVQNNFGTMFRYFFVISSELWRDLYIAELKLCCRPVWQMNYQHTIYNSLLRQLLQKYNHFCSSNSRITTIWKKKVFSFNFSYFLKYANWIFDLQEVFFRTLRNFSSLWRKFHRRMKSQWVYLIIWETWRI